MPGYKLAFKGQALKAVDRVGRFLKLAGYISFLSQGKKLTFTLTFPLIPVLENPQDAAWKHEK